VLVLEGHFVRKPRSCLGGPNTDIDHFRDFPGFQEDTHPLTEENHPGGTVAVVHQIKEDDGLHEDVGEDRADRDADVVLLMAPM